MFIKAFLYYDANMIRINYVNKKINNKNQNLFRVIATVTFY